MGGKEKRAFTNYKYAAKVQCLAFAIANPESDSSSTTGLMLIRQFEHKNKIDSQSNLWLK